MADLVTQCLRCSFAFEQWGVNLGDGGSFSDYESEL